MFGAISRRFAHWVQSRSSASDNTVQTGDLDGREVEVFSPDDYINDGKRREEAPSRLFDPSALPPSGGSPSAAYRQLAAPGAVGSLPDLDDDDDEFGNASKAAGIDVLARSLLSGTPLPSPKPHPNTPVASGAHRQSSSENNGCLLDVDFDIDGTFPCGEEESEPGLENQVGETGVEDLDLQFGIPGLGGGEIGDEAIGELDLYGDGGTRGSPSGSEHVETLVLGDPSPDDTNVLADLSTTLTGMPASSIEDTMPHTTALLSRHKEMHPFLHQHLRSKGILLSPPFVLNKDKPLDPDVIRGIDIYYETLLRERQVPFSFPVQRANWIEAELALQAHDRDVMSRKLQLPREVERRYYNIFVAENPEVAPEEFVQRVCTFYNAELKKRGVLFKPVESKEQWLGAEQAIQYYEEVRNLERILQHQDATPGNTAKGKPTKKGINWGRLHNPPKTVEQFLQLMEMGPNAYPDVFKKTTVLNLSGMGLTSVPRSLFTKSFPSLQIIDLSDNLFEDVPSDFFCGAPSLRSLILRNNHISRMCPHLLSAWHEISYIDLSNNRLSMIPPRFLKPLVDIPYQFSKEEKEDSNIRTLNLSSNDLCRQSFTQKDWEIITGSLFTSVDLCNNPRLQLEKVPEHVLVSVSPNT